MTVLLPAIVPVGLIILIGFIAARTLSLERQTLSQLTVYILVPALVADSLYQATLSLQNAAALLTGFILTALIIFLSAWGVGLLLKFPASRHKSLMITSLFGNNGNLGLPLIAFAFGEQGLERAVVYMIGSSILMFGLAPSLLKGNSFNMGLGLTLKLPLFWAIIGGLLLRLGGIKLSPPLAEGLHQLGRAAIPVALIILGMQLASTSFQVGRSEILATMMRLLGAPLIAYIVGHGVGLEGIDLQVLTLQSAMPIAVNTFVLVNEFGGDPPWVARSIVVSTLMSFFTLPLVLWVSTI